MKSARFTVQSITADDKIKPSRVSFLTVGVHVGRPGYSLSNALGVLNCEAVCKFFLI